MDWNLDGLVNLQCDPALRQSSDSSCQQQLSSLNTVCNIQLRFILECNYAGCGVQRDAHRNVEESRQWTLTAPIWHNQYRHNQNKPHIIYHPQSISQLFVFLQMEKYFSDNCFRFRQPEIGKTRNKNFIAVTYDKKFNFSSFLWLINQTNNPTKMRLIICLFSSVVPRTALCNGTERDPFSFVRSRDFAKTESQLICVTSRQPQRGNIIRTGPYGVSSSFGPQIASAR